MSKNKVEKCSKVYPIDKNGLLTLKYFENTLEDNGN